MSYEYKGFKIVQRLDRWYALDEKGNPVGFANSERMIKKYVDRLVEKWAKMERRNIARKADVPWQDPAVQAHWEAGFHTAWDEPEDHPQYPYAGDIQQTMMTQAEWDAIQARRRRMYGRKKMNPSQMYKGFYIAVKGSRVYAYDRYGNTIAWANSLPKLQRFLDLIMKKYGSYSFEVEEENPAELAHDVVAVYEAKGERGVNRHRILVTQDYDGCFTVRLVSRGVNYKSYGGFCNQDNLNNFLMNIIYDLQLKAGLDYSLVYP